VLALVLIAFSAGIYSVLASQLRARFDDGMQTTDEGIARSLDHELSEGEVEPQAVRGALNQHYFPSQAAAIFDAQGRLLAENPLSNGQHAELPAGANLAEGIQFSTVRHEGKNRDGAVRIAAQRVAAGLEKKSYLIVVSQPLHALSEELELLRNIFLMTVPLALLLAGMGGWFLARKSLAPIVTMSESARRISAERLGERLPVANPRDELGRLAVTFNEMLARLQSSFTQQRQFMADASHELRTPLSVMRTAAEVTLEQPHRHEAEYREALTMIDEQLRRLSRLVEEMFTLARADAGSRELAPQDFYLDELIAESARAASVLAARKEVDIDCAPAPETPYRGDESLLRQMLLNLLDNAVKHTPAGGRIMLRLERADTNYLVTVADTGTGIPAEAQPHIFKRFYRADKARSRAENGGGAGLGLSIAQWIAEAHCGSLTLQYSDQRGSAFRVSLPVNQTC
jgi:heavy metal sensor kinase